MSRERIAFESVQYPNFYHHPTILDIVISRDGEVIDLRTGNKVECGGVDGDRYIWVSLPGYKSMNIHRLKAETFLKCPGELSDYQVNHIDGIKTNNDLDNLEFVTCSGNVIHAYETGLRTDNRPVLCRHLKTGVVKRFYSLQSCAKHFGVNGAVVFRYLNSVLLVPFRKEYDLVYEGQDWNSLSENDIGKVSTGQPRDIVVVKDNKVYLFEGAAGAAEMLGISVGMCYYLLQGKGKPEGFLIRYVVPNDILDPDVTVVKRKAIKVHRPNFKRNPVEITVKCMKSGVEKVWVSTEEFASSVNTKKNTIQKSMYLNKGRWKHYLITYNKVRSVRND